MCFRTAALRTHDQRFEFSVIQVFRVRPLQVSCVVFLGDTLTSFLKCLFSPRSKMVLANHCGVRLTRDGLASHLGTVATLLGA